MKNTVTNSHSKYSKSGIDIITMKTIEAMSKNALIQLQQVQIADMKHEISRLKRENEALSADIGVMSASNRKLQLEKSIVLSMPPKNNIKVLTLLNLIPKRSGNSRSINITSNFKDEVIRIRGGDLAMA